MYSRSNEAFPREKFVELGVNPEEVDELIAVGELKAGFFKQQQSIPLLLPYCAKPVACKFRYIDGCGRCGKCDVGEAFSLAEEYGMEPITIQNYEMLEERLKALKESGCKAFVGTCCKAFWIKHHLDFEQIGLPGILVNVDDTTCYDVGKQQEAYRGSFGKQTKLKNDLIRRLVNGITSSFLPPA